MLKSKTKYRWEGWESSGRESWVFNVKHPCELIGVHAKLIDNELEESEKVEYCIYVPRISSTSTSFGLKSEESSCGICVTDRRFIISKNRHIKEHKPSLDSINFNDVLYINFGGVMLLSWFSITYICEGSLKQLSVLFASNGRRYFEKAIRSYKKYLPVIDMENFGQESFTAASFIHKIADTFHKGYLKNLISTNERCILNFSCRYLWDKTKKRKFFSREEENYYATSKATILLTNKTLFFARDSLEFSVGNSVDILNIPLEKIEGIMSSIEDTADLVIYTLKIYFKTVTKDNALIISLISQKEDIETCVNKICLLFKKQQ